MDISAKEYLQLSSAADKSEARRRELAFIIEKMKAIKTDLGIDVTTLTTSDLLYIVPKLLRKQDIIMRLFSFFDEEYIKNLENLAAKENE
jgi:hypothetical protein